jgi:hypothetical protein
VLYAVIALIPIGLATVVYALVGEVPDPAGLQFIDSATATGGALTWVVYHALWPEPKSAGPRTTADANTERDDIARDDG